MIAYKKNAGITAVDIVDIINEVGTERGEESAFELEA